MPKSRIMSAGTVGTSKRIRVNGPEGGGNKLQGLPPICNMRSPLVPYVRTRADGENRNVVFCINQLSGGVGAKRGQFGPGNRAGVGQTGGCAKPESTPWWYNNPAVLAAANLLANHFSSLQEILVLVGISETLAGDLGADTPVSDTMKHYARLDDTAHAAGNYDGLPTQELKDAVDLLNSMRIHAAVPSNILGGPLGPMRVQRHIVGTVDPAGLLALTQPPDPDDKIGYTMSLSSTQEIWVLGGVSDITGTKRGGDMGTDDLGQLTRSYWHITFEYTGWGTDPPPELQGRIPDFNPSPGRYFQIWYKSDLVKADACECSGTTIFGLCDDWVPAMVCKNTEPTYWVKFVTDNTPIGDGGTAPGADGYRQDWATDPTTGYGNIENGGSATYWIRLFFEEDGRLCEDCDQTPRVPTKPATMKIKAPSGSPNWDGNSDLHKILMQMRYALSVQGSSCFLQNAVTCVGSSTYTPYFELSL